ncbi:aldolase [Paenibacillus lupini]
MISEVEMPELWSEEDSHIEPDVSIEYADLRGFIQSWEPGQKRHIDLTRNEIVLHIPEAAYYRIVGSSLIQVMPEKGSDPREVRIFLLGVCLSIVMIHRGIVPMHASGVMIDGKAYIIVGDCGAGKSTLGAAFRQAGYKLISDDIVGLSIDESNILTAYPGYPQQKLWQQSLDYLNMESANYDQILDNYNKFAVPFGDQFIKDPLPLAGIFELEKADIPQIAMRPLKSLERVQLIRYHLFLGKVLNELSKEQWLLNFAAKAALAIPFYQLKRPLNGFTAPDLVNQILNKVREGEVVHL